MAKDISKMMNEGSGKGDVLKLIRLTESNIEKAEIVLAVKGEIVDKLQRQAEVINNMSVDVLGPLLDRIKAEHGVEAAESFKNNISGLLTHAVSTLMDVKDKISTETLKLTGDITSEPSISDMGDDGFDDVDNESPDDFDFNASADFSDDLGEPTPDDREMKESVKSKRLGIQLESTKGKVGTKYFSSKDEMNGWLLENVDKIAKVIKIIK